MNGGQAEFFFHSVLIIMLKLASRVPKKNEDVDVQGRVFLTKFLDVASQTHLANCLQPSFHINTFLERLRSGRSQRARLINISPLCDVTEGPLSRTVCLKQCVQ